MTNSQTDTPRDSCSPHLCSQCVRCGQEMGQTDRQTDRHTTTDRCFTLTAMDARPVYNAMTTWLLVQRRRNARNLSSRIDLQTHASSAFDNCVNLTFGLLPSDSTHAGRLPCTVCLPSLVLTARVGFLLWCGHIHTQRHRYYPLITRWAELM